MVLHQHSSAGSFNGFRDLGHRLDGCWELVTRYYPTVYCLPMEAASRKKLRTDLYVLFL